MIASLAVRHPEIRALRRSNGGPGLARETGRQEARGDFIQYLDSDDVLMPHKFERQVQALEEHPDSGVAYGIARYRDTAGRAAARGAYIARHDAGDLSHPRRFKLQQRALDADPGRLWDVRDGEIARCSSRLFERLSRV